MKDYDERITREIALLEDNVRFIKRKISQENNIDKRIKLQAELVNKEKTLREKKTEKRVSIESRETDAKEIRKLQTKVNKLQDTKKILENLKKNTNLSEVTKALKKIENDEIKDAEKGLKNANQDSIQAQQELDKAKTEQDNAIKEYEIALQNEKEANDALLDIDPNDSESEKRKVESAKNKADIARRRAEIKKNRADEKRKAAEATKKKADDRRQEAEIAKMKADEAKKKADDERKTADKDVKDVNSEPETVEQESNDSKKPQEPTEKKQAKPRTLQANDDTQTTIVERKIPKIKPLADFFEPQSEGLGCGRHALNNLLGDKTPAFSKGENKPYVIPKKEIKLPIPLREVCQLVFQTRKQTGEKDLQDFCQKNENYEVDVLLASLNIIGFNFHKDYSTDNDLEHDLTNDDTFVGYLINLGNNSRAGVGIAHWVAIKYDKETKQFHYIDSFDKDKSVRQKMIFKKFTSLKDWWNKPNSPKDGKVISVIPVVNTGKFIDPVQILKDSVDSQKKDKKTVKNLEKAKEKLNKEISKNFKLYLQEFNYKNKESVEKDKQNPNPYKFIQPNSPETVEIIVKQINEYKQNNGLDTLESQKDLINILKLQYQLGGKKTIKNKHRKSKTKTLKNKKNSSDKNNNYKNKKHTTAKRLKKATSLKKRKILNKTKKNKQKRTTFKQRK